MKKKIDHLRELWAVPKYNLIIKFILWGIFFAIIYGAAGITSLINKNVNVKPQNVGTSINFTKMKNNLVKSNINIDYSIGDYYITGIVSDNVLTGTLEYQDIVYKIKYDGDKLYQIKKETEVSSTLLSDINLTYLLPSNVINNITDDTSLTKSKDNKIYSYTINNVAYSFYLSKTAIEKVIILDNNITYEMKYNILSS